MDVLIDIPGVWSISSWIINYIVKAGGYDFLLGVVIA